MNESGRIYDTGGNLGKSEDLETPFYRAGAPRPVQVKTGSLPAGFAQETMVKRDGYPVCELFKEHGTVECVPVELLLEILPKTALAGVSMTGHGQEIHSPVYYQYQNHCLNEETFESFSNISDPIESGGYNRPYLDKELNSTYNLLILNLRVTNKFGA